MLPTRRGGNKDPIRRLKDEFDNVFDRFFKEPFFGDDAMLRKDSFSPVCNIEEKDKKYTIEAEMPGVNPDNIDIEIDNGRITIKGTKEEKIETEDEENQMHVVERSYGSFYRSFTLPENVNTDEILADYKNGILTIDIPKTTDHQTKRIQVQRRD